MNSAKNNAVKGACSQTRHDCSIFFSAESSQAKNSELLLVIQLFQALEMYSYSLTFHMTTITLFLS